MGLMDIYNNLRNPIDDPEVLNKIIEIYSQPDTRLYSGLVRANNAVDSRRMSNNDSNEFYSMIFSIWKNSITSLTKEQFIEMFKKGIYDEDLIKIRKYLLGTPDLQTTQEIKEFIDERKESQELTNAMDKYKWSKIGEESGWEHIDSKYIHARRTNRDQIEHRLYLRVDSMSIHKIGKCFIEKCEKANIPYYFKFVLGNNRDDSIVVYSSTKHLNEYIEILNEIKKENPEISEHLGKPPLLTSKINDWIGYGSEPAIRKNNGDLYSFNLLREEVLEKSIIETTGSWLNRYQNMEISFQNKKIKFSDYILIMAAERFVLQLERRYDNLEKMKKQEAQNMNKPYNEQEFIDYIGYTRQDLKNPLFKENIYKVLSKNKNAYINAIITGKYSDLESLNMTVRNNKKITFTHMDLNNTMKAIIPRIAKNVPEYIEKLQTKIKENGIKYGIDPNNFSFDSKRVQDMKIYDDYIISKQLEEERNKKEINIMLQPEIKKPRERMNTETDEEYEKYLKEFYNEGDNQK